MIDRKNQKIMKGFMYLFRGRDYVREQQSPEEMQAHMQKWGAWIQGLTESGNLVAGLPLEVVGKVVENGGDVTTDGPFAEGKEVVAGNLIVKAKDIGQAVELSKGCPIYEHNGCTEVRETMEMPG